MSTPHPFLNLFEVAHVKAGNGSRARTSKRRSYAGAIISGGKGTADEKFAALEDAGVKTVRSLADIGSAMAEITGW